MKKLLVITLLLITSHLYGNKLGYNELRYKDSIELIKTWKKFKISLNLRDTKSLRLLSLKIVNCDFLCHVNNNNEQDISRSYITINRFLTQFYHNELALRLRKAIKTKKYQVVESTINYRPANVKYLKTKSITLYDILYVTIKPNEFEKGNEGQQEGFEFVKINGKYKFFGLTSIP